MTGSQGARLDTRLFYCSDAAGELLRSSLTLFVEKDAFHLYHPANAPTAVAEQKKAAESWAPRCTPTGQLAATLSVQLFAQTATPSAVQPLSNLLFNSARMQVRLARSRIIRLQTPAIDRKRMGAAQPQSGTLRAKER